MTRYQGKRVVITGGTVGMGLAIAERLVAGGAEVVLTGRDEQRLAEAGRLLGPGAHVLRSDAGSLADIAALAACVRDRFGAVDALFVNAGVSVLEPFGEVTEATYDWIFNVNAKGAFFTVQRLAPLVADGGSIVFTTAVTNLGGFPTMSVYSGSKAAAGAFAKVFASELLPRGIRVNAVSPGFIRTPSMGVTDAPAEVVAAFEAEGAALTPMGRVGDAGEVAEAALFLAFEATFTTGVELGVDGGLGRNIVNPELAGH
ncbi:SDR family oxidoreductase [Longispora sp. NPDC051575]|uniref:SDR family oxidoreductase n=1 Tax=Longispora sp. NPDC051575 TaxID=3154943 RepID=UPI003415D215